MPKKLLGRTEAAFYTPPLRRLNRNTSLGYEVADFAERVIGEPLLPWQRWAVIHAMELKPDGTFRFRKVVIIVARQNGKSFLNRAVNLWRMYMEPGSVIYGVAQEVKLARKQWNFCQQTILDSPALAAEFNPARKIGGVRNVNGDEYFWLANRSEYAIGAASRKSGRGSSNDGVNIDELREQRDWKAWAALSKTTNARPNPQIWCMSNAGDDESVVLNQLQDSGHDGRDESLCVLEWSAPKGCELDDPRAWAQANPSLGYILSEAAIRSDLGTDPPDIFRCLDITTPVLTARGTLPISELRVGDAVKGTSGEWTAVLGTSETHSGRDCYKVTLNDGRSIVCDAGHLWTVRDRRRPRPDFETLRTTELILRGVTYHNPSMNYDVRNFSLPPVAPLDGPDVELPVHSYLLGLWLGDGSRRSATIFTEARDADHIAARMEAAGATITTRTADSANCERIGFRVGAQGVFIHALRSLGIYPQMPFRQAPACDFRKFIPDVYLTGSLTQRLDLLRGLMDSDGTVSARSGRCCFINTNAELIAGVRSLVRSLGWKTSDLTAGQYGKSHHLPRLSVDFTPRPGERCPVTVPRKAERIRAARGCRDVRPVTIVSIERVPSVPVRCIKVDAPDSLFLAGDLVPTHNTEVLCQRVPRLDGAIDYSAWTDCADATGTMDALRGRVAAVFDVAPDGGHYILTAAALLADGRPRIEVIDAWDSERAARTALPALLERVSPRAFGWFPGGPAAELATVLRPLALRYNRHPGKRQDGEFPEDGEIKGIAVSEVCMELASLVRGRAVVHAGQELLNDHIRGASKLYTGDGWRFTRKGAGHCNGAYAAAGAVRAALTMPEPRRTTLRMLA